MLLDSRPRVSFSLEALRPRDLLACADPPVTTRSRLAPRSNRRSTNHRVELRLTANLQLQRLRNPSDDLPEPKLRSFVESSTARFR